MQTIAPYTLALCRPRTDVVFGDDGKVQPAVLERNLAEYCTLIASAAADHDAKLIVFPQFGLSGYAVVSTEDWVAAALEASGAEIARIAQAAQAAQAYVVVQAAERHPAFPGRYFLSAFLLTPEGEVGMVYRKNYTLSLRTSPIEVYDRFIETFGDDAFYPVLDTPLGRLGMVIGAEVHWPESVRSLALKGAEIVLNPIAAAPLLDYMRRSGASQVRTVRAFENMVYLAMANVRQPNAPAAQVYDFNGDEVSRTVGGDDLFTLATIDLDALRAARAQPTANFLAQIQPSIHTPIQNLDLWPANIFADTAPVSRDSIGEVEREAWARLQAHWRQSAKTR